MKLKFLAILLATTLVLASIALWQLRPKQLRGNAEPPSTPLLSVLGTPNGIGGIRADVPQGKLQLTWYSAAELLSGYVLTDSRGATRVPTTTRVDGLLWELANARAYEEREVGTTPYDLAIGFCAKSESTWHEARFSVSPGPHYPFICNERWYWADRPMRSILTAGGLQALADMRLAPLQNENTERIEIVSEASTLSLQRTAGGWMLTAPTRAAADPDVAERARIVLTDKVLEGISWDMTAEESILGLRTPRAEIRTTRVLWRDPGGTTPPIEVTTTLRVGANADVAATSAFVLIEAHVTGTSDPVIGPYIGLAPTETLNKISRSVSEYLAKTALSLDPSLVRSVKVGRGGESARAVYTLVPEGWQRDGGAAGETRTADLRKVIEWLKSTKAAAATMDRKALMPQYTLALGPLDAPDLVVLGIGRSGEGVWIQTAHSELRYAAGPELLDALDELLR